MNKTLISLLTLTIFAGCAFHKEVDRKVASEADAAAPQVYPYRVRMDVPHDMRVINNGIGALYERIKMIREAKRTLELEYFIFNPDASGRIVFSELIKAAKRGVKVRVLVDKSVAVFALNEHYAKILKDNNVELRYYNPAIVLQISSVQFRDHRKLIVRDGEEAITGGRNIADEYFNLAKEFNFLDRDVWVKGEVVKAMEKTFDIYWDADIVQTPEAPVPPKKRAASDSREAGRLEAAYKGDVAKYEDKKNEAKNILVLTEEDQKKLDYIINSGPKLLEETEIHTCPSVAFATDKEGGNFKTRLKSNDYNENFRLLRKEIALWMGKINDGVLLDSPYFLNDNNSREILVGLLDQGKKVTILTNSLASTDAIYVATVFSDEVKKYAPNPNFNAYIYKATFSDESELYNDEIKKSMWGTHSKTVVFNDNAFMVGTFNIDNRSNFYNSEMALFCQNSPELTRDVENNIRLRMKNAHHLDKTGSPEDGSKLLEGTSIGKKGIYFLLKVPSTIMQFLM